MAAVGAAIEGAYLLFLAIEQPRLELIFPGAVVGGLCDLLQGGMFTKGTGNRFQVQPVLFF